MGKGGGSLDKNIILPYVEPIFRFCCRRLSNRYDAEDLAGEILCHVLDGMEKYQIESLDAWVWQIAHNRYARFLDKQNKNPIILFGEDELYDISDYTEVDETATEEQYESVFRYLHTLSSEYRNIFVDYYIGELSVKNLAEKYSLAETTVKWRLNIGRRKIRERMEQNKMNRVYQRINWNTTICNGNADPDAYLHSQVSRAICLAAYEMPLSVDEISLRTGIPAMYIEDELPRLEYGDAICRTGSKYATNFIIFRLTDRRKTDKISEASVNLVADRLEAILKKIEDEIRRLRFYGSDFGVSRLGYIIIPYLLRRRIRDIKTSRLKLEDGPYPPRKDGGYGWFLVEETEDDTENAAEYSAGCDTAGDEDGGQASSHIYYYWISKYFDPNIYHNKGTRWLCANGIPQKNTNGTISQELLTDENAAQLIRSNLLVNSKNCYQLNFPCFTGKQFRQFTALFDKDDEELSGLLEPWIRTVRKNFENFVPARLYGQINQWLGIYLHQLIGQVTDELIRRDVLRKPDPEKPLTDGVFFVEGEYINP